MFSKEPKGEFARYAYGYSDKKPWVTVVILVLMFIFILWRVL